MSGGVVSTTTSRISYAGNGTTTAFSFPYPYLDDGDFTVVLVDADGDETTKTLNTHYTVVGASLSNGVYDTATITMTTAPASGETLVIFRAPALTQEFNFASEGSVLPALTRYAGLNELKLQRLDNARSRSVRLSEGTSAPFSGVFAPAEGFLHVTSDGAGGWEMQVVDDEGNVVSPPVAPLVYAVENFGAVGDNDPTSAAANTAAIQAAIDAADSPNAMVTFGPGTFYVAKTGALTYAINWKSGVIIQGAGKFATVIKLANSQDCNVIESDGATALFGGGTDGGIEGGGLFDFCIDGNRSNQASGSTLVIYGDQFNIARLRIINFDEYAIKSEWAAGGGPDGHMEARVNDVECDTGGKHGVWWNGPHDSVIEGCIVIDAGQDTNNTYDGFFFDANGGSQVKSCHAWHRPAVTNRMRRAVNIASGCTLVDTHCEGAVGTQLWLGGTNATVTGGRVYGSFDGANGVVVTQPCRITGTLIGTPHPAAEPDCTQIVLGTGAGGENVTSVDIDAWIISGSSPTIIDFTNDGGKNSIRLRGFVEGPAAIVSTPHTHTRTDIKIWDSDGRPFTYDKKESGVIDATNNNISYPHTFSHHTTGSPAAGIGVGQRYEVETAADNYEIIGEFVCLATDVTSTSEDGAFAWRLMTAGAAAAELMRLLSTGFLGLGTTSPDRFFHVEQLDAVTNATTFVARLTHTSSGTVTTSFGVGYEFELENASGTNRVAADAAVSYSDATDATEDATWTLRLIRAGTIQTALTINSLGTATFSGVVGTADGTINFPAHTFANDFDCGLYRNAANDIRFGIAGTAITGWTSDRFSVFRALVYGVQSLSGAGAIDVVTPLTKWTTTGANAGTLADGVEGQVKEIVMIVDAGDGTLTPTNLANLTTITFNDVGDSVQLRFLGTEWWVIANNGCTLA